MFLVEISETSESLKTKMSELRLYCDLLMQQVHTIQEFVHRDESRSSPSVEVLQKGPVCLGSGCTVYCPGASRRMTETSSQSYSSWAEVALWGFLNSVCVLEASIQAALVSRESRPVSAAPQELGDEVREGAFWPAFSGQLHQYSR